MVFDGSDILVKARLNGRKEMLVVTFTGRDTDPPAPAGAGEGFFVRNGISAVHFISKANHWWQTAELDEAIARVVQLAQAEGFGEIVTYGSSMGGFGALIAAGRLGASRAVVSVPQYSINPVLVPWEERWQKDARRIAFCDEDMGARLGDCLVTILLDPLFEPDARHATMIAAHRPVQRINVPFAEHDVSRVLSDLDLLKDATLDAVHGRHDEVVFRARLRASRAGSALVWAGAARLLARSHKPRLACRYSRRGFGLLMQQAPPNPRPEHERLVVSHLELLISLGLFIEAHAALDRWEVLRPPGFHEFRLRAAAHAGLLQGGPALHFLLAAARARGPDRAMQFQMVDTLRRFADAKMTGRVIAEFTARFLKSGSPGRRAAELLAAKGLAKQASALAAEVAARHPKERSRLQRLILEHSA